jgi:hypothetical protein
LPELLPVAMVMALTPLIGSDAAVDVANRPAVAAPA